jgi:hypothetical protein
LEKVRLDAVQRGYAILNTPSFPQRERPRRLAGRQIGHELIAFGIVVGVGLSDSNHDRGDAARGERVVQEILVGDLSRLAHRRDPFATVLLPFSVEHAVGEEPFDDVLPLSLRIAYMTDDGFSWQIMPMWRIHFLCSGFRPVRLVPSR